MGILLRDQIRLARLRERLEDRPNDLRTIVRAAQLEYHLGSYDDAEGSIARALLLGHVDDGTMMLWSARINMRRHTADTSNTVRDLRAALASFGEALRFKTVSSNPVHYLEVTSAYLKLNETQKAANSLATILVRWPQSREATVARETCAQTLISRGQASEALTYYKALLVDSPPRRKELPKDDGDRAEIDLPVASGILGGESLYLQMGLCYEKLNQKRIAGEAYRQAWNALVEEKEYGSTSMKENTEQAARDEIDTIIRRATEVLRVRNGNGSARFDGRTYASGGDGEVAPRAEYSTRFSELPGAGVQREKDEFPLHQEEMTEREGQDDGAGLSTQAVPVKAASVQMLAFQLWEKDPYTWFKIGKSLLQGRCYTLALSFLDKAIASLPAGLEEQEKDKHLPVYKRRRRRPGDPLLPVPERFSLAELHLLRAEAYFQMGRFSDARSVAEHARDLEPCGNFVRLLCPRLMALDSETAQCQYARQSMAAMRLQKAWRKSTVNRVLKDSVTKQIAAMRIQRFMREWRQHDRTLAIRMAVGSAQQLSQLHAAFARGVGATTVSVAQERYAALVVSALSVQQAARALVARRRTARRRNAVSVIQACFRGCKERGAITAYLEECSNRDRGCTCAASRRDASNHALSAEPRRGRIIQVGAVTRLGKPMDADSAEGFTPPNAAALLWRNVWDQHDIDAHRSVVPHAEAEGQNDSSVVTQTNVVFEVCARAVASINGLKDRQPPPLQQRSDDRHSAQPLTGTQTHGQSTYGLWVSPAVAPEASLARALRCSMLVVNSPTFSSSCARRLFSRIGREDCSVSRGPRIIPFNKAAEDAQTSGRRSGVATQATKATDKKVPADGIRLTHLLVVGESPMGDAGLSAISLAVQHGRLMRLANLTVGGPNCRVGPRGITALAMALSTGSCPRLRVLSLSYCCLGQDRRDHKRLAFPSSASAECTARTVHLAWNCFFRHLQRMLELSSLSLQNCGLDDRDVRSASIAIQILPTNRLRRLQLNRNCISESGLRMLLRALTSKRIRLASLWLRRQRPAIVESRARDVLHNSFEEGLFAEVEFERARDVMGGRAKLVLVERTSESENLGVRASRHTTSNIYI